MLLEQGSSPKTPKPRVDLFKLYVQYVILNDKLIETVYRENKTIVFDRWVPMLLEQGSSPKTQARSPNISKPHSRRLATVPTAVLRMQIVSVMHIASMRSIYSMSQGSQSIHQIKLMALLQTELLDSLRTYRWNNMISDIPSKSPLIQSKRTLDKTRRMLDFWKQYQRKWVHSQA